MESCADSVAINGHCGYSSHDAATLAIPALRFNGVPGCFGRNGRSTGKMYEGKTRTSGCQAAPWSGFYSWGGKSRIRQDPYLPLKADFMYSTMALASSELTAWAGIRP
jgi:hypothetical protein